MERTRRDDLRLAALDEASFQEFMCVSTSAKIRGGTVGYNQWWKVPETRGKPLEQIEREVGAGPSAASYLYRDTI
jgi:hypothetical protein